MLYGLMAGLTSADVVDDLLSTWKHVTSSGFGDYYERIDYADWTDLADTVRVFCDDGVFDFTNLHCNEGDVFCDGLKMQIKCLTAPSPLRARYRKMLLAVTDLTRLDFESYEYVMNMDSTPVRGREIARNHLGCSLLWGSDDKSEQDGWTWKSWFWHPGHDEKACEDWCTKENSYTGWSYYRTFVLDYCGCFEDFMISWRQTEFGTYTNPIDRLEGSGYLLDANQPCKTWRNAKFTNRDDNNVETSCEHWMFKGMDNQLGYTVRPSECNWRCRFMGNQSNKDGWGGCNLWKLGGCEKDGSNYDSQCQYWDFDEFRRLEDVGQSWPGRAVVYGIPCKGDIWPPGLD